MKSMVIAAALSALMLSGGTTSALHGAAFDPRITAIVPEKPTVSPKAVTVVVNGEDFQSGLSLQVTTPGATFGRWQAWTSPPSGR